MNIIHIILFPITSVVAAVYYATALALLPVIAIIPLLDWHGLEMWLEWLREWYIAVPIWILTGKHA